MPKTPPITHPALLRHIDPSDGSIPVTEILSADSFEAPEGLAWFDDASITRLSEALYGPDRDGWGPSVCTRLGIEYAHARLGFGSDALGIRHPVYGGIVLLDEDLPFLEWARNEEIKHAGTVLAEMRLEAHLRRPTSYEHLMDDPFEDEKSDRETQ